MMEDLSGSTLKGYELQERIGSGGFGAVYKAHQTTVGREVAIKIILPGFANRPDFIRRFESEAQLVARLEHPYITPLYDYWRDPNGAYLVMRYLRGGSLRDTLHISSYDLEAANILMTQITAALAVAHRNNVIHRDLKPGNILLDEDSNAYLADFGIAKNLTLRGDETDPDEFRGTPDYISPEQARGEPVTPQTDIYSLGVVLYEMLTGKHPFPNLSSVERLIKHINDPLPLIENLDVEALEEINAVIQQATQKNPAHRYADVLEFAAAFRQAIDANHLALGGNIVEQLTQREQEILQLLIEGCSNREIATKLFITLTTVRWYLRQIYRKLGVRSRVQAIVRARELDLVVGKTVSTLPLEGRTTMISGLPEPENPFMGLRAFRAADTDLFFGREKLTAKLLKRLAEKGDMTRFLAVVGASGSGKSSVVKAGLIPAIWRGELPGSEKWFVVEMLPGSRPLDELEVALMRVAADQAANLGDQLRRDQNGLLRVAQLILPNDESELLLVIDQFEELFTLVEHEHDRKYFLDMLYTTVTDKRSRVRVVLTLRADFYDRPLQHPGVGELMQNRTVTVLPLSAEDLERAIRLPAEKQGVRFEEGLIPHIIEEVNYQAGALPLLQYALTELFEQRENRTLTRAAYQEIGGTVGALAKRAEELYQELTEEGQETTRQMFLRLVTLGEGVEDTRRRTPRSELSAITSNEELLAEIIDIFAEYRLLSLDHDPTTRTPTVEVAHEAILREWERLRNWLNENRADVRMQRQLAHMAEEWRSSKQDQSFLVRGSRLEMFEQWMVQTGLAITAQERNFVKASLAEREREVATQKAQEAREAALTQRAQRVLRGLVAVFLVAAMVAGGLAIFAMTARNAESEARQNAERSAGEFRSIALAFGAQNALNNKQHDLALALALEAVKMDNPPLEAETLFRTTINANWMRRLYFVSEPDAPDAQYLPDGEHIIAIGDNGRAVVINRNTNEEAYSLTIEGERLQRIGIHPDGNIIAIGSRSDKVYIWTLDTGEVQEIVAENALHSSPVFNADGTKLITGSPGRIYIWDMATRILERSLETDPEGQFGPTAIRFSSDESLLVTSSTEDGLAIIWDFETGEVLQELNHNSPDSEAIAWVWNAQFLNHDEWIITASDLNVTLWNWRNNEIIWQIEAPRLVQDISLTPDQQWFVVGLEGPPAAQLYHLATGTLIREYYGQSGRIRNVEISPDGRYFVSASQSGTVGEWPLWWEGATSVYSIPLEEIHVIAQHPSEPIVALGTGVTAESLETGQYNSIVYVINTDSGEVIQEIDTEVGNIGSLTFSPDGQYLLSGDTPVFVWNWKNGDLISQYSEHNNQIRSMAFSPDGQTLIEGEATVYANILIRNVASGEIIKTIEEQRWIRDIEWSPDGTSFYVMSETGLVRRDAVTGEIIQDYRVVGSSRIAVTSNGERLIVGGVDSPTRILDTSTGTELLMLDASQEIAINPDETILATYRYVDGVLTLWNIGTGQRLQQYSAFVPETPALLVFSHDGSQLITAGTHQLIFWEVPVNINDPATWATENRYIPDFTCKQRDLYQIEPLCPTDP